MRSLLLLFVSLAICAGDLAAAKLQVVAGNDSLVVFVEGDSLPPPEVDRTLYLGEFARGANLEMRVVDDDGREWPFSAKVNDDPEAAKECVILWPSEVLGRRYRFGAIASYYDLPPGTYWIRAIYRYSEKLGDLKKTVVESNKVRITIAVSAGESSHGRKAANQALQTTPMTRSAYEKTIDFGRPQRGV